MIVAHLTETKMEFVQLGGAAAQDTRALETISIDGEVKNIIDHHLGKIVIFCECPPQVIFWFW